MADPVTMAVAGAGIGALTNPDDPLKSAALGGLGGFAGGSMLGLGAAGSGAGAMGAGAANNAMYAALPGLSAAAPGSQAAMLAAQTAEFGTPGLLATGEALAAPGSMQAGMFGAGNNLFGGTDATKLMKAGNLMQEPQQPQQRPVIAQAPQMPQGQNATIRPYSPGMGNGDDSAMMQLMPGMNAGSPFRR